MRSGNLRLMVGALIVVGVIFMLVSSIVGQRPFDAPTEDQPEQEETAQDVVTSAGNPGDTLTPGSPEEAPENQRPPEE